MADIQRTTRKQSLKMAGVIAGVTVGTLNTVFWVLSGLYYNDKPLQAASIDNVRIAFVVMTLTIAGSAYLAALAPRLVGHGLAAVIGLSSIVGGIAALTGTSLPDVMGWTMVVSGVLFPLLIWYSLHHSRAAWAFLIALLVVFATVTFFGAPKVRHVLGIGLWHALIIPGLQIVAAIGLSMLRDEYRESAVSTR
jgi:hypothetical protein